MNNSTNTLLNYRVVGNGYPVVFLHGFLESISMWEYLSLSQNNQKILIDLPGHGTSDFTKTTLFSMQSVAKEVKRVIDELNIQEYHLVGHSMGGYIGIELMKIDVRCDKLILLNSNFSEDIIGSSLPCMMRILFAFFRTKLVLFLRLLIAIEKSAIVSELIATASSISAVISVLFALGSRNKFGIAS